MQQKKSPILEMLNNDRGNMDKIPQSKEYEQASNTTSILLEKFVKQLKEHPKLFNLYYEFEDAMLAEFNLQLIDVYKEAFSFGFAMAIEILF